MACYPGMYHGWSDLTDELHDYITITSNNRVVKNMVWRGVLPGIY